VYTCQTTSKDAKGKIRLNKPKTEIVTCGDTKPTFQYVTQSGKNSIVKADNCASYFLYDFRYNFYQKLSQMKWASSKIDAGVASPSAAG
jgi:hypothetical protein